MGLVISVLSVLLLGLAANWLAAGLLAFTIFFYAVVYTVWLKRSTPQNIVIGGAAGALPPVIGWAAVTGSLSIEPLLLFAIVMVGTPGPANMLLMTSGANFGFWRSVPFVSGVALGKLLINGLLGLGLWEILSTYSEVLFALKMVSVAYLAWLALRMSGFLLKKRELKQAESFW